VSAPKLNFNQVCGHNQAALVLKKKKRGKKKNAATKLARG